MKITTSIIALALSGFWFSAFGQTDAPGDNAPLGGSFAPEAGGGTSAVVYGGTAGLGPNRFTENPVSVLCFKEPDRDQINETLQDVGVLAFLLSRNLEHNFANDAADYKMGIPMLLTSDNQAVSASYIQGFGAILKLQVRFPLMSSSDSSDQEDTTQKGSEWETARREMIAQDNPRLSNLAAASGFSPYQAGGVPYNAKFVETFKKRILVALKNASNLRHVDGNEWIMVKVVGAPCSSRASQDSDDSSDGKGTVANNAATKQWLRETGTSSRNMALSSQATALSSQATVLAMRVKKSAADAFAAGSLSEEQFIKGAEVAAYLNPSLHESGATAQKK